MIRTENEYRKTVRQLADYREMLQEKVHELEKMDLTKEQIGRVTEAEATFFSQLEEEIHSYENLKRKSREELDKFVELRDTGKLLIALRIFSGLSQSELAALLNVDPSQVSRDERNEYQGITIPRIQRITAALGGSLKLQYEPAHETTEEGELAY